MKEYKNGYLLTDKEHEEAIRHNHVWLSESNESTDHPAILFRRTLNISHCECGAIKMLTAYGWRVLIPMSPNKDSRFLAI